MFELNMLLPHFLLFLVPFLFLWLLYSTKQKIAELKSPSNLCKSYPVIGHFFAFYHLKGVEIFQWFCDRIISSPSFTILVHRPFAEKIIMTGNPTIVKHILKTKFDVYEKGSIFRTALKDFLGDGIVNSDGDNWKFQRQVAVHEFNTKSLRKFVENVVDFELNDRLIPILKEAAKNGTVIDFQDILQRFTFDNICLIGFGYDPKYLSPSLSQTKLVVAFEDAVTLCTQRLRSPFPFLWKIRRFFNTGSEKKLKRAITEVREFANLIVAQKKQGMSKSTSSEEEDLLTRFLKAGQLDEKFIVDIVISFILGGRDTSSAAMTWLFWLLHKNKEAEEEIVREVNKSSQTANEKEQSSTAFDEVKDLAYTHAALCESMRLYPPVPIDTKQAASDDILPDGTCVKKGMRVGFLPYVMGRLEAIWGPDWAEYRPERWLNKEGEDGEEAKWKFVPRDPYSFPVFQAGPRICIGREMAFLQMKRVVAGVLEKFKVIPAVEEGFEPVYLPNLSAKMRGGLPVRIEERV